MSAKDVASDLASHPFVRLATSVAMIVVTLVVMPFTYWMTNTVYAMDKGQAGTLIIQSQQQNQIASIIEAQAKIAQSTAELSLQTTRIQEQLSALKEQVNRNNLSIDKVQDRIDRSPSVPDK